MTANSSSHRLKQTHLSGNAFTIGKVANKLPFTMISKINITPPFNPKKRLASQKNKLNEGIPFQIVFSNSLMFKR